LDELWRLYASAAISVPRTHMAIVRTQPGPHSKTPGAVTTNVPGKKDLVSEAHSRAASSAVATAIAAAKAIPSHIDLAVPVCRIATFHLNGLGDLLFTLPALLALRESFPGANICAVVRPTLASLLRDSPLVDEILLRPQGGLSQQTTLMLQLRARHIDLVVAFSQSRVTTMLAWSTGAATRAGFASARLEALLTHRVPKDGPPTIEAHLALVRSLGCRAHQHNYRGLVHVSPAQQVIADKILAEHGVSGPFGVVACEASRKRGIKEWPDIHWAAALDELANRLPVVLVGTQPSGAVTKLMRSRAVDLGGCTDLMTLAALCERARLFVGIDSGVMHLAAAMGTPVVGIFGPTDWRLTNPRGVPYRVVRHPVECSPCLLVKCKWDGADHRKCLTRLEPSSVVEAARELIGV
jgi:heptosyltransferase I